MGLIPGSGRPPGGGNGNPLQSSCLGKPMDRGAWWATVHGVAKSQTHLSDCACLVAIKNHHKSGGFKRTETWDFLGGPAVKTLRFLAGKLRSHILCGMGAQAEPRSLFCHSSRGQKGKVTSHLGHDTSKGTCYLVTKSDSLRPRGLQPSRLLCPWHFPGKNTGVGCHFLLQGIFLTQGSNPVFCIDRWVLYH